MDANRGNILHLLVNWLLFIVGLVALITGVVYLVKGVPELSALGLTGGLVLVLAASVDRFESLKGWGIEAKRQAIDKQLTEARQIATEISELTKIVGKSLVDQNMQQGRWQDPVPPHVSYELVSRLRRAYEKAGLSNHDRLEMLSTWIYMSQRDAAGALMKPLDRYLRNNALHDPDRKLEADAFIARMNALLKNTTSGGFSGQLQAIADSIPSFIPAAVAEDFRSSVRIWAPKLDYLCSMHDFQSPNEWIDLINESRKT